MLRMSLGKQVTTYLRGRVAEGYEAALKKERKTSYALLTDAVEEYLSERGYIDPKKVLIPVVGPHLQQYTEELEARTAAIISSRPDLARAIVKAMQGGEEHLSASEDFQETETPGRVKRRRPRRRAT